MPVISKRINETQDIPIQAIIICESLFWSRAVTKIIKNQDFKSFDFIL